MLPFAISYLAYGVLEARRLIVREFSVYFEDLPPEFDGYSILHLSDFHFRRYGRAAAEIRRLVRNMPSDIAVLTGDYRYKNYTPWAGALEAMKGIVYAFDVRDGVFGCLGNKESQRDVSRLEELGLRILRNSSVEVRRGGSVMHVLGVDERYPFSRPDDEYEGALKGVPKGSFKILLSHTPDYLEWAKSLGIQLLLCGDTHGGQVRMPLLGPLKVKSKLGRKYCRGWFHEGNTKVFINSGLGSPNFPVRTLCPPEIVRIVLRAGSI